MARENFPKAMAIELRYEGGKVDDPRDPGGRTNQGVIQRVYSAYRAQKGLPVRDVYLMEPHERDEIYRRNYADKVRFDDLPSGIDLVLLDGAINSGPAQSVKWVQRALGLTADGIMGDVTMNAITNQPDMMKLIDDTLDRRMLFLRQLKPWPTYKNGWTNRVNGIRATAKAWARNEASPIMPAAQGSEKKANLSSAKPAPARALGDATGGGGGMLTVASQGIEQAKDALLPASDLSFVSKILIGFTILGVLLAVVGFGYSWWARKRKAELEDALDLTPQDAPYNNDNTPREILELSDAPTSYQGSPAIKSI